MVSLSCMLYHLHKMDSSDSLLVQHLLTILWPESLPHTWEKVLMGLETGIFRATEELTTD